MEFYVRALVESLKPLVSDQIVICARSWVDVNAVNVVELGDESLGRSPSLSHQLESFSVAVRPKLMEFKKQGYLIHSHERVKGHNVSTQHGPLIEPSIFSAFSPKYRLWKSLECNELDCRAIVPVSKLLADEITHKYPMISNRLIGIGWPGMPSSDKFSAKNNSRSGKFLRSTEIKALFVGRETKRKGLNFAIDVVKVARAYGWNISLSLIGPEEAPENLPKFVHFLGWKERVPYEEFDLLIHPARQEPFGMCVTEAYCAGIPSFVSENVGAKDLGLDGVFALRLKDKPQVWAEKILTWLASQKTLTMTYRWSWDDLALFYYKDVYENL